MASTVLSKQQNGYIIVKLVIKNSYVVYHFPIDKNLQFNVIRDDKETQTFHIEYNQVGRVKNFVLDESGEILPSNIKIKNFVDILYGI